MKLDQSQKKESSIESELKESSNGVKKETKNRETKEKITEENETKDCAQKSL